VQSSTLQCRVQLATPKQTPRAGPSQTQVARVSARHPRACPSQTPFAGPSQTPRACPSLTPLTGPSQTRRELSHTSHALTHARDNRRPPGTRTTRTASQHAQRSEPYKPETKPIGPQQRSQKEPIQNRKCGQKFGSLDAKNASEIITSRARLVLPSGRGLCGAPGAWPGDLKRRGRRSVLCAGFTAVRRSRARELFAPLTWPVKPTLHTSTQHPNQTQP